MTLFTSSTCSRRADIKVSLAAKLTIGRASTIGWAAMVNRVAQHVAVIKTRGSCNTCEYVEFNFRRERTMITN
jgi:hypothetical protein